MLTTNLTIAGAEDGNGSWSRRAETPLLGRLHWRLTWKNRPEYAA